MCRFLFHLYFLGDEMVNDVMNDEVVDEVYSEKA